LGCWSRAGEPRCIDDGAGAQVDLLDISGVAPADDDKKEQPRRMDSATAAAQALRSLSFSAEARRDLYFAGGVPLLTRLTGTGTQEPVVEARTPKTK